MFRTFLALDLDDEFLRDVLALIDELRAARWSRVRWVTRSTMHVTLRFLGDTDEGLVHALAAIVAKLGEWHSRAVDLRSTSLLAFPNEKRARVLALGLDDGGAISELAAAAEREVIALGFEPEQRSFRPHLTLARFREPADLRRLVAARSPPMKGGRLSALTLYRSELGKEAPTYTVLTRVELL